MTAAAAPDEAVGALFSAEEEVDDATKGGLNFG